MSAKLEIMGELLKAAEALERAIGLIKAAEDYAPLQPLEETLKTHLSGLMDILDTGLLRGTTLAMPGEGDVTPPQATVSWRRYGVELTREEDDLLSQGKKIEAIKMVRTRLGASLKEAKRLIDQFQGG